MAFETKKLTFENSRGDRLDARLDRPQGEATAYALFAHCFSCSKESLGVSRISSHLAGRGVAVFRFDFTGLGKSGGEFSETNFSSNVEDVVAAAEFMAEEFGAPEILIGHSFGGTAVLKAAAEIPSAKAVCTIGAPFDPAHIEHLFSEKLDEIEENGSAEVVLAGRRFTVEKHFIRDIRSTEMERAIGELRQALLILHSPEDRIVGIDNARLIYQAARHSKSFVSLDGADHLLTDSDGAQYVADVLTAWATRYVDYERRLTDEERAELGPPHNEQVVVSEAKTGEFTNHVTVGRHHFYADEPVEVGGRDAGPDPYELVAASLGACTSMTLRMYADKKGWPLDHVEVRLDHEKIHAEDCAHCEEEHGKIDELTRLIRLEGDLSDEQRERLLEIADLCPVHETLTRENAVVTELIDEPTTT